MCFIRNQDQAKRNKLALNTLPSALLMVLASVGASGSQIWARRGSGPRCAVAPAVACGFWVPVGWVVPEPLLSHNLCMCTRGSGWRRTPGCPWEFPVLLSSTQPHPAVFSEGPCSLVPAKFKSGARSVKMELWLLPVQVKSRTHALLWPPGSQSGARKKFQFTARPPICESPELPQSSPSPFRFHSRVACGASVCP